MTKLSKKKVLEAAKGKYGNITQIAKACNVNRESLYVYLNKNPDTKTTIMKGREELLDIAEGVLATNIKTGDSTDSKWVLSRLGKARGYGEQTTIKHEGKLTHELFQQAYQEYHDKEKEEEEDGIDGLKKGGR